MLDSRFNVWMGWSREEINRWLILLIIHTVKAVVIVRASLDSFFAFNSNKILSPNYKSRNFINDVFEDQILL